MALIGSDTHLDLGSLNHHVLLEQPTRTADGDGGFTQTWAALSPSHAWANVVLATQRLMERLVSNAVQSLATHIVTLRYHPQVTLQTRVSWTDRANVRHVAQVTSLQDVDSRGISLILLCTEVLP